MVLAMLMAAACHQTPAPQVFQHSKEIEAALATISGAGVRSHMEVLAADGMQGREADTSGFRDAAAYVARHLQEAGLDPLGDDGTYFQEVDFLETRLVAGSASLTLHRDDVSETLRFGEDFIRFGGFGAVDESVTAPLVFVGFGITAPEYCHDDFAGVDIAGKILVVLTGAPPHFANDQRAFYSSSVGKQVRAVDLDAVGILTIRTPVDRERLSWPRMLAAAGSPDMRWIDAHGTPRDAYPELSGDAMLSDSGAERLFALAGRELPLLFEQHGAGKTGSFDLGVSATVSRKSEQRRVSSPNVLGLLRGSDHRLRDEYLIYSAHLDHLGTLTSGDEDEIHNGAYDNAAGVASVLEIARAMARMKKAPRRSIIFSALTAEEMGLQGSDYLAHNMPVPIRQVVANINIDMPFLGFPIADIEGLGVEHSTLQGALERATAQLGLALTPDPLPELVRLIRSDQFSFVKQGVPGLNLKPGTTSSDPSIDGAVMHKAFLRDHYHGPSDDLSLPYSESGAERFVRAALMLGLIVANDDEPPRWNANDFFGERFASDEPRLSAGRQDLTNSVFTPPNHCAP